MGMGHTAVFWLSWVWVTLQCFGHGCDSYSYSIQLCYTAADHQTVTVVYSYSQFYLQVFLFFFFWFLY